MNNPAVIVITGLPATGKSFLAQSLASELRIPLVSKDGVKEAVFDVWGWDGPDISRKVAISSLKALYYFLAANLAAGVSTIVESNFDPKFENERFIAISERFTPRFFQVLCHAEGSVLWERFRQRAISGSRHPGHADTADPERFRDTITRGRIDPLDLPGDLLELDMTEFSSVNYQGVADLVREFLNQGHDHL